MPNPPRISLIDAIFRLPQVTQVLCCILIALTYGVGIPETNGEGIVRGSCLGKVSQAGYKGPAVAKKCLPLPP